MELDTKTIQELGVKSGKKYVDILLKHGIYNAKEYIKSIETYFCDERFRVRFEYSRKNQFITELFKVYDCDVCAENFYEYILENLQILAQNDGVAEAEIYNTLYEEEKDTSQIGTFEDFFREYDSLLLILSINQFNEVKENLKAWYDYGYISGESFEIYEEYW